MKDTPDIHCDAYREVAEACRDVPRVLHVDGDGDAALVLATLLVPETQVHHAASLAEAVRAINEQEFALVVLDPDLPDGDGADLLHNLSRRTSAPPVLLYSARHPGLRTPAHAFLPKPWTSPRQLWRTVSHMLGLSSASLQELPI
ncbi:response regulator [Pseudoduganella rivuli]|nr:response regulator [Pseudoduganella rivuli]